MLNNPLAEKRIQLAQETTPRLERVAFLMNPDSTGQKDALKRSEAAARALNLQFSVAEVRSAGELEAVIAAAAGVGLER